MTTQILVLRFITVFSFLFIISCEKEDDLFHKTWDTIDTGHSADFGDIFLLPNDTIMLLGKLDLSFQNCILESDNGGDTWEQQCFDKLSTGGFYSFYCLNNSKMYGSGEGLYRSNDGGENWQKIDDFGGKIYFVDDNVGFHISGNSIFKTTNGGQSFESVYETTSAGYEHFQFPDNQTGYVACNNQIVKSSDGGDTWEKLSKSFNKNILGLSFISAKIGYVISDNYLNSTVDDPGYIYKMELSKTTDGGNTWIVANDKIYDEISITPFSCHFVDEKHGFLCGTGQVSKIFSTSDGGNTWQVEYEGTNSDYINDIEFTYSGKGYAAGDNGLLLKRK